MNAENGNSTRARLWNRGFAALVATQFLGALNDNYLKMIVSLFAVDMAAQGRGSSAYLSLSGIMIILPYLLFSGYAGYLADQYDKRSVLIATKGFEVLLAGAAMGALFADRMELLLAALFLLAAQSAFFLPAKLGIVPEAFPATLLSRANGALEMTRYLAIIGGTVIGGALVATWKGQPFILGSVVIAIALAGFGASLGIIRTRPAQQARALFPHNPWREIVFGTKRIISEPKLRYLVMGTTCFDFFATLLVLNLLLFAKLTLGLDALGIGLLAAGAGVGIGAGSAIVGRLSGRRVELSFVAIGAIGAGLVLVFLGVQSVSAILAAISTLLIGCFAGLTVVPLYAALQRRAPSPERGRIIATNNFLNMAGVLAASATLWALHDALSAAPAEIFLLSGTFLLTVAIAMMGRSKRRRLRVVAVLTSRRPRRALLRRVALVLGEGGADGVQRA